MWDYFRFRSQRLVRRVRRRVWTVRRWLSNYVAQHLRGKWRQVAMIRRFLLTWGGLVLVAGLGLLHQLSDLAHYYTVPAPITGGQFAEGVVGQVNIINPVLPEAGPAADVASLVFDGLTRYNDNGRLVGDLAQNWSASSDGRTYTFNLRPGVKWHDGVPFTAQDVAFTLTAIQNPDSRSPLANSWQGVTAEVQSDTVIEFKLPNPNAAFLDFTTVGIVPRHLLEGVDPSGLRAANFNQHPVGTGPFKLQSFLPRASQIELAANPHYFGGQPRLNGFVFKFYDSPIRALEAYDRREVNAVAQILPSDLSRALRIPGLKTYDLTLPDEVGLFLRNSAPVLQDGVVRQALSRATDREVITRSALQGLGVPVELPILPGQLGYDPKYNPAGFDLAAANSLLDGDGWLRQHDGMRTKNGQLLKLTLVTRSGDQLEQVARLVAAQWGKVGVQVSVKAVDLDQLEQSYIRPRNYDVLLYGISIGADPDVYVYWHSSQVSDPGLNLSQYNSETADHALESARTKTDATIRAGKYGTFLTQWSADAPAIMLYQPEYIYAAADTVHGIAVKHLIDPTGRFYNVQNWTVLTRREPIAEL